MKLGRILCLVQGDGGVPTAFADAFYAVTGDDPLAARDAVLLLGAVRQARARGGTDRRH